MGKEILHEAAQVMNTYLHGFKEKLESLPDTRLGYVYSPKDIIYGCIFMFLFRYDSRNNFNNNLNEGVQLNQRNCNSATRKSFYKLFKCKVPHPDTIDIFLRALPTDQLEKIKFELIQNLLERKTFNRYKFFGTYAIAIDGTGIGKFKTNVTDKLTCKETDKTTSFYAYVVEAKLITSTGLCISLATEWVENTPEYGTNKLIKQDCERVAFMRIVKTIHDQFPRLPITLCLDALFCYSGAFEVCKKYKWNYVTTMKNTIPSARKEVVALKKLQTASQMLNQHNDGMDMKYYFLNEVSYNDPNNTLNWASVDISNEAQIQAQVAEDMQNEPQLTKKEKKKKKIETHFEFVTNMTISKKNVEEIIALGRLRWKIENQGFDHQKNHSCNIEHKYSRVNECAMKNYYQCAQIAHLIEQLAILSKNGVHTKSSKMSYKFIFERIRDILISNKPEEVHFVKSRKIMILK